MTRAKKSEAASGKQLPLPPRKQRGRVRLLVAGAVVCAVGLVATAMILPVSAQDALGIDIRKIREEANGPVEDFDEIWHLTRFGDKGEAFDPMVHEALMHQAWPEGDPALDGAEGTTVVMVLQPGYKTGDTVIRPARVAVADPA